MMMMTTTERPAKAKRGRPANGNKDEAVRLSLCLIKDGYSRHQAAKIAAERYSVNVVTVLRWLNGM